MIYQYSISWTQSYPGWNEQFDCVGDNLEEATAVISRIMNL